MTRILQIALIGAIATAASACEQPKKADAKAEETTKTDGAKANDKAGAKAGDKAGDKGGAKTPTMVDPKKAEPAAKKTVNPPPEGMTPDAANTAKKPPVAEDLARYTSDLKGDGKLMATINTTMGTFQCELYDKVAPITVANFVGLARGLKAWTDPRTKQVKTGTRFYDGIAIHRVIPRFMIQTGDPMGIGIGGPGYNIVDEFDPKTKHDGPGILSMANKGAPTTGGSQFFITEVATPHLNNRHTVFGKCDNEQLVKEITHVKTDGRDRPVKPINLTSITISRK